jgi:hypothetical protein
LVLGAESGRHINPFLLALVFANNHKNKYAVKSI